MSNYHGDIMNIPVDRDKVPVDLVSNHRELAYKQGHRDARHEAAELGEHADCVIEELRDALKTALAGLHAVRDNVVCSETFNQIIAEVESALKLGGDNEHS